MLLLPNSYRLRQKGTSKRLGRVGLRLPSPFPCIKKIEEKHLQIGQNVIKLHSNNSKQGNRQMQNSIDTNSNTTKNLCGKMRDVNKPYEIWTAGDWEWRVLKKYQSPDAEAANPCGRWFCAVKSPHTFGSFEYGDTYINEIKQNATRCS